MKGSAWDEGASSGNKETTKQGGTTVATMDARFMEDDGIISENHVDDGGIKVIARNQENSWDSNKKADQLADSAGGGKFEKSMTILDPKRKRVEEKSDIGFENPETLNGLDLPNGSKNLKEVGPVIQAHLNQ